MTIQPDLIALSSGRGLRSPFDPKRHSGVREHNVLLRD